MRIAIWMLSLATVMLAARAGEAPPDDILHPGKPAEVYVAPGRATTVLLHSAEKIAAISLASPVVSYKYDKSLNQLEITPAVRSAGVETNLNLRIGANVYILLVKVVNDVRVQFLRDFTLEGDPGADDEAGLSLARPLKPAEVDMVGAVKLLERARVDPVFQRAQANLRMESLDQVYSWNDCLVTLAAVGQLLDRDLLVFRVEWVNRTDDALYLDVSQYGLFIDQTRVPIIARYKVGTGSVVFPGQLETVYLAVQGYRLSRHNRWQLGLPPSAEAVGRLLSSGGAP